MISTQTKSFRKLGYTPLETAEIASKLNILLANYHIHYQKLRNFHWNVQGPDFFELHEKFEDLYNSAKVNIDDIAERIRVFGQTPISTLAEYLHKAEIEEAGTDLSSRRMVEEVIDDFRKLLSFMMDAVNAAIDIGDTGTERLVNGFVTQIEKEHWMLTSFLQEERQPTVPAEHNATKL